MKKCHVNRHLEDLQDIYKNYLKPYEKLDDTYRSRLNKIYSSRTSAGDKWANFWDGVASVADSFVTAFAIAAVTAFIAALTPAWLAVAGVVLLGVGVAVMANIPEESVPDWLKPVKEGADGIADKAVKMLKEGPVSVVEDIGQGLMDEIQTPEGIASVAGGTVGTLAGGYAASSFSKVRKVERPSWRQSELDAAKDFPDYNAQKSFKKMPDGMVQEVPYGTKGSVRPDYYKSGHSVDINDLSTINGRRI